MERAGEPAAQVAAEGERVQLGERPPGELEVAVPAAGSPL